MKRLSPSVKIYIALVVVLSILTAINAFLPQGDFALPDQEIPLSKPVIALVNAVTALLLYGGLGFIGLKLSQKLGFSDLWDDSVSNQQRFLLPAVVGIGIGLFFIVVDLLLSQFHTLGPVPHPPFPTSIIVSAIAAIGEEIIFRLFFIPFWVWLIAFIILRKRWQEPVFWIVALFSALAFALGHIPSAMVLFGITEISAVPPVLLLEIMLLNGVLSLFAAHYFKKHGFLAAVGIHFWVDVVWHVIWGVL
ncbi:MAG: CPBP family intramembrane metalloprotease [Anaerolineae bacterium]|nr:CPBP family intramembrane metalloprotease [Anaerolineae bacterium]